MLITAGADRSVLAWSPHTGEELLRVGTHETAVAALAVSPGMRWMATGGEDGGVILWDLHQVILAPPLI